MMSNDYHQDVRTTLTLDPDVAAKLKGEVRRSGRPFKEVLNTLLRQAFAAKPAPGTPPTRFTVEAHLLEARTGIDLDNVGQLLEQLEGPRHG